MPKPNQNYSESLVQHFFRNEYGKMVAVISKYVTLETAEDIIQDTLLTAVEYWQHNGIPTNPQAWLYTTAKNKSLNWLRKNKYEKEYQNQIQAQDLIQLEFTSQLIEDEQLRIMLACCQSSISEESQVALILKILCGFSISEIASAFCTNNETINKRLVRGREKLRTDGFRIEHTNDLNLNQEVLLKTIYLLFNEGYFPSRKDQVLRKEFCLEAIRLTEILISSEKIKLKEPVHALLALMCLNCSRFEARTKNVDEIIEMERQDRALWNQELINKGFHHLDEAQKNESISKYLILASISANHSISINDEQTNWSEILNLYDALLTLENSAIVQLNRLVAFAKVNGSKKAISEILQLQGLETNYLFYSTLAHLYADMNQLSDAKLYYEKAIALAINNRDKNFLLKKINSLVPISKSHV